MLQRVPRRLYKGPGARPREGSNVEDLVHANSFLGFGVRTTHPASYAHLLGRVGRTRLRTATANTVAATIQTWAVSA